MLSNKGGGHKAPPSPPSGATPVTGNETNEIIEELFDSLLQKYQKCLEESIKGSECFFDSFDLLYYKLYKISLNIDGSYIDSTKCLKNKGATINPEKNDNKFFQHAVTCCVKYVKS